jgi:hypothetical protein
MQTRYGLKDKNPVSPPRGELLGKMRWVKPLTWHSVNRLIISTGPCRNDYCDSKSKLLSIEYVTLRWIVDCN